MTEQEIDALYPCQQPCDSFGVCDNCCEKKTFKAGYQAAMKENEKLKKEVELIEGVCHRLELFLCCNRGECTACDLSVGFICPECSAHKDVIETLQKLKELRGEK